MFNKIYFAMKQLSTILLFLSTLIMVHGQNNGDYRSINSGNWNNKSNWEKYSNGLWIAAPEYPPSTNLRTKVTIQNYNTITATADIRGSNLATLVIDEGGTLNMTNKLISGYPILGSNYFPEVIINGSLFTNNYLSTTRFSIGPDGYFKTAYSGIQGWYFKNYKPTYVLIEGSVEYNGTNDQIITGGINYKNLILSGSGYKSLDSITTVTDSLIINSGASLNINGDSLIITGDINNEGSVLDNVGTGTVIFNGENQNIKGSGEYIFPVVFLSGQPSDKTLFSEVTVTGTLTIDSGIIMEINGQDLYLNGPGLINDGFLQDFADTIGNVTFGGGEQYIDGSGVFGFPGLVFAGSGNKLLSTENEILVYGLLKVDSLAVFNISEKLVYLFGEGLENNGTILTEVEGGGLLAFDGEEVNIYGSGTFSGTFYGFGFGLYSLYDSATVTITTPSVIKTMNFVILTGYEVILGPETKIEISQEGSLDNFNENMLILKSSATSTASLINYGNIGDQGGTGSVTVERYLSADQWHIVSAQVSGMEISSFLTDLDNNISFKNPYYAMTVYLENKGEVDQSGGWGTYFTSSTVGELITGKGYLLRRSEDGPVKLNGEIITGDHSINIIRTQSGWNCIGNPYTSSIGVSEGSSTEENFLTKNASQLDSSFAALYIYDPQNPTVYQLINNANSSGGRVLNQKYLQSGQGFIVRSKSGGGTIDFTTKMQAHQTSEKFYKKSTSSAWPFIKLNVKTPEKSASTTILFHRNMTRGLDVTYDAGLFSGDPALKIYSRLVEDNGVNFALQCLPDFETTEMIVPVGIDIPAGGLITLDAETFNLPAGYKALLEDRQQGIFTDLQYQGSNYTTTTLSDTKGIGRFFLHITSSTTDINNIGDNQKFNIFAHGKEIYIQGNLTKNTIARIYDITGKLVKTCLLESEQANLNIIGAGELKSGIYFVKLESEEFLETGKIYLE